MRTFIALFCAPFCAASVQAQGPSSQEKEVLSVIDRFFAYMTARDSAAMASIMEPHGQFIAVEVGRDAKPPRVGTHAGYLSQLKKGTGALLERYWDPVVQMDPGVAVVTCPYDFHIDGNFSHCGLDIFTLVKRDGTWRIAGAVFSMQKQGCTPSPLGPVR